MPLKPLLAGLLLVLPLTACVHYSVAPKPSEALLQPCRDPEVPAGNTDTDYAVGWLNTAQAYVNCRNEKAALATWARGLAK
jgi:hypothetical protein